MFYYSFSLYALLFLVCILISNLIRDRNNTIVILLITVFFGLREGFGNDYEQYVNIFRVINEYKSDIVIEPGAYLINWLSYIMLGDNGHYLVFLIYTLLTIIFINRALRTYNCEKYLVVVIFLTGFIFFANNAIRQAAAISFLLYSLQYIYNQKPRFIIYTLISVFLFHYSAILYLGIFLVPKKKASRLTYVILLIVSFGMYKTGLVQLILTTMISYIPHYGEIYATRISDFVTKESGAGLVVIFWYVCIGFYILHQEKIPNQLYNISIIGSLLFLAGIEFEMWERIFIPLFYLNIIVMALVIKGSILRNKFNLLVTSCFIITLVSLTSVQIIGNKNKNKVVPYNSLFISNNNY